MRVLFWVGVASGPLALGLWWWAGGNPALVESLYSRGLYPLVMGPWSRLTASLPLALAPVIVLALAVGAVGLFLSLPPLRALSLVGAGLSVLLAWFVLGWGLNYQRPSWAESHGWKAEGGTTSDLEALADHLASRVGDLRRAAFQNGTPDWAGPGIRTGVGRAYLRVGETEPLLGGRYGDPKAFPAPEILSWLGIAGIFIPHTGEPLVNTGPADWQLPFTAAHEAAHLRGWSREDEANFLAFLVLRDDPDPVLAYSAWGAALLYVASALQGSGPGGGEAWGRVAERVDPAVLADWKASFAWWDRYQGPARAVSQAVNDAYLKSQGQADGVKSYGRMVDLLLVSEALSP